MDAQSCTVGTKISSLSAILQLRFALDSTDFASHSSKSHDFQVLAFLERAERT